MKRFPPAVMATAFATFIAFMGIGVVDPILPIIGKLMGATAYQVEWLFTSYIAIMALTMLISGVLATRIGGRKVMLYGIALVIGFSLLSGISANVGMLAAFRAGWGLGNAFFTSTALSIIVGASSGGIGQAITLYEAALGHGIASGPLLGGLLGEVTWRLPFFGTSTLMAIAFLATFFSVKEPKSNEPPRKASELFKAMGHPAVISNALVGLTYSYAFFTILAYSPLTLKGLSSLSLGYTYFAWGLLVGISSVFIVNWLRPLVGPIRLLLATLIGLIVLFIAAALVIGAQLLWIIVISGLFCGMANALFTSLAMEISPYSRSISSGTYNFVRWSGAALAPVLSGWIGDKWGMQVPFWVSSALLVIGCIGLFARKAVILKGLQENGQLAAH